MVGLVTRLKILESLLSSLVLYFAWIRNKGVLKLLITRMCATKEKCKCVNGLSMVLPNKFGGSDTPNRCKSWFVSFCMMFMLGD